MRSKFTDPKHDSQVILREINRVLKNGFKNLLTDIDKLKEPRKRKSYKLSEIIFSAILLFIFKRKSRNNMDAQRKELTFNENYFKLFGLKLPSMNAVNAVLENMDTDQLEGLVYKLNSYLIEKDTLSKFKLNNRYTIAIDATGIHSDTFERWSECTTSTSKNGVTTYKNLLLKASIVTTNGMSLPFAFEWISNEYANSNSKKQDVELSAFKRLAPTLKEQFPRLPITITVDALYCNEPFMDICEENNWKWIVVFKEGCLPSVQEELDYLPKNAFKTTKKTLYKTAKRSCKIEQTITFCNDLQYNKHTISWIRCEEISQDKTQKFEYLTNIIQGDESKESKEYEKKLDDTVKAGRLRWNIEEEFNDLKNRDFGLEHLQNRNNFNAFCNWVIIGQIAYLIYNLVVNSLEVNELLKQNSKRTIKALWENLISYLKMIELDDFSIELNKWLKTTRQIRLAG